LTPWVGGVGELPAGIAKLCECFVAFALWVAGHATNRNTGIASLVLYSVALDGKYFSGKGTVVFVVNSTISIIVHLFTFGVRCSEFSLPYRSLLRNKTRRRLKGEIFDIRLSSPRILVPLWKSSTSFDSGQNNLTRPKFNVVRLTDGVEHVSATGNAVVMMNWGPMWSKRAMP
jgi:hypothetical protein